MESFSYVLFFRDKSAFGPATTATLTVLVYDWGKFASIHALIGTLPLAYFGLQACNLDDEVCHTVLHGKSNGLTLSHLFNTFPT